MSESDSAFAKRAGLPQRTVNRVAQGDGCHSSTALAIIRASEEQPTDKGGTVTLDEIVEDFTESRAAS